jgi:hypothetical protein
MTPKQQWSDELQRSVATLSAIRQCVADSPRQRAWAERTERAIERMAEHAAGVTQARRLVGDGR